MELHIECLERKACHNAKAQDIVIEQAFQVTNVTFKDVLFAWKNFKPKKTPLESGVFRISTGLVQAGTTLVA